MKKLIPYILAYLIVAGGTLAYSHLSRHTNPSPYFTLHTTMTHDELVAKLQQVGIPESAVHLTTVTPAPFATLVYHFVMFAIYFAAFAGLTLLFQRVICTKCKSHDVAA
jgi:hypothetical protein